MRIFEDDDAGYLAWIEGHQHGFVVNTYRKPDRRYLSSIGPAAARSAANRPAAIAGRLASSSKCARRRGSSSSSERARSLATSCIRAVSAGLSDCVLCLGLGDAKAGATDYAPKVRGE
jgi:hypothetical protein